MLILAIVSLMVNVALAWYLVTIYRSKFEYVFLVEIGSHEYAYKYLGQINNLRSGHRMTIGELYVEVVRFTVSIKKHKQIVTVSCKSLNKEAELAMDKNFEWEDNDGE